MIVITVGCKTSCIFVKPNHDPEEVRKLYEGYLSGYHDGILRKGGVGKSKPPKKGQIIQSPALSDEVVLVPVDCVTLE